MNIFIVDKHPVIAAKMLCDQHVVKMITESVQMLSTCHRVLDGTMSMQRSVSGKRMVPRYKLNDSRDLVLYHAVHFKHPCNIWIREDISNYNWLLNHTHALCQEYTLRYKKIHACESIMRALATIDAPYNMPVTNTRTQTFVQAMPEEYKNKDPVIAYRNFYIGSKSKFARWKYTKAPNWYTYATAKSIRSISTLHSNQESLSY